MVPRVATAPALEPVTLAEAKEHLRLEHALDDATVTALITAARQHIEEVCWRGLVTQTLELTLGGFPCCEDRLELPGGHLGSIVSVVYVDADGGEQTLAADQYEADTTNIPGRLRLAYGASWPNTRAQWNAVRIRYVVGWAVDDVPAPLKQALLLLVSHFYEQRSPEVTGTIVSPITFAVDSLVSPYRLARF